MSYETKFNLRPGEEHGFKEEDIEFTFKNKGKKERKIQIQIN